MKDFVHLHLHTQYSLLDGAADIGQTVRRAAELGMPAVAITDHGSMYGVIEFYLEAMAQGIKPIVGCEVYTAPRSRTDKDVALDKHYGHLVLLCKDDEGYRNLLALVTKANTEGFYYKPRVDMEILREHCQGLIALSACLRGDIQTALLTVGYDAAVAKAREYISIFGEDNFYLEVQNHSLAEEDSVRQAFVRMSSELGIGLVATNDVHYVNREDALVQDVLTCIQTGKKLSDTDRLKMEPEEYYFKTADEMYELFADMPQAVSNTVKIANRCNLIIDTESTHLPKIDIHSDMPHPDYLAKLSYEGLLCKYGNITEELKKRMDYELSVINSMGYTDYFLVVHDFIKFAKDSGISVGPGRGSAAGSIVAYALNITEIDPMKYNLLFERFLNPERVSMPDIDIDFCYKRRDEVRSYVASKYGSSRVAQIATFGTLAARAAIKDVGRVLGIPLDITNRVSKAVPGVLHIKLKDAIRQSPELANFYNTNPEIRQLLDIAMKLEGVPRNVSTHAAGVVIGDDELTKYVPLQPGDSGMLTQYPMASLERIGLLKMDFLGLRNLTIIDDAVELVNAQRVQPIDIECIDTSDSLTFELIQNGDTDGVFQLENPGLQSFMKKFRPSCLEDIITTTSIYRPGPMEQLPLFLKNVAEPQKIVYKHPLLKPILEPTYGVVIYQEQVMKIVRSLAGYSLGRADLVRRTMAKKKPREMEAEREVFLHGLVSDGKIVVEGAVRRGIDEKTANEIFDSLVDFANYAFNKSHAACYALVAFRTAYLKAHWPTCYLAAVLRNYAGYVNKAVKYIASFAKYGIKVLAPDINMSFTHFVPEGNDVRFGLCWLKGVGDKFPDLISAERAENGLFVSFEDFIKRMAPYGINKRTVEVLIKCGCFDSVYPNRRVLLCNNEYLIDKHVGLARSAGIGQLSWFSDEADSEAVMIGEGSEDFTPDEKMSFEYEFSSFYFSGHPLDAYRMHIEAFSEYSLADLNENGEFDGAKVNVCGRITNLSSRSTKSGKLITSMTLSDYTGSCSMVAFENNAHKYSAQLQEGNILAVTASVNFKDDNSEAELIFNACTPITELRIGPEKSLYIKLIDNKYLEKIKNICAGFKGENNLYIYIVDSGQLIRSDASRRVMICEELWKQLTDEVGAENLKIK